MCLNYHLQDFPILAGDGSKILYFYKKKKKDKKQLTGINFLKHKYLSKNMLGLSLAKPNHDLAWHCKVVVQS